MAVRNQVVVLLCIHIAVNAIDSSNASDRPILVSRLMQHSADKDLRLHDISYDESRKRAATREEASDASIDPELLDCKTNVRKRRAEIDVITMFRRMQNMNMKENFIIALLENLIEGGYVEVKNPKKLRSVAPGLWNSLVSDGLILP